MISTTFFLLHFYTHSVIGLYPTYTVLLEPAGNLISYTIAVMHKFSVEFDNASIITGLIFSNKSAAFFSFIVQSFFVFYIRLVQYSVKLIWWNLKNKNDLVEKLKKLESSMSMTRKCK